MTEPNALDRMFNAVVSDREVKRMIQAETKKLFAQALVFRLPDDAVKREVRAQLTKWIKSKGLTGRGTKKLVDKAIARAMKGYCRSLHELNSSSEFDKFRDIPVELHGTWADRASDRLRSPWPRRVSSKWAGERAAAKFARKRK